MQYSRNLGIGDGIELIRVGPLTTVSDAEPQARMKSYNYPNPFNPFTVIQFDLPFDVQVKLMVYTLSGRRVATLLDERRSAGPHKIVWHGVDDRGRSLSSGVYVYRLAAGDLIEMKRMVLVR
jgi:hypothetical protein